MDSQNNEKQSHERISASEVHKNQEEKPASDVADDSSGLAEAKGWRLQTRSSRGCFFPGGRDMRLIEMYGLDSVV